MYASLAMVIVTVALVGVTIVLIMQHSYLVLIHAVRIIDFAMHELYWMHYVIIYCCVITMV